MEVRISSIYFDCFVPGNRLKAKLGFPMEFYECELILGVDKTERVNPKSLHEPKGPGDSAVGHDPHDHMHAFGSKAYEVPEIVMGRLSLRKSSVGLLFDRMYYVRKFYRILDKENRDIITNQIPVAFLSVELDGKSSHVPRQIERALIAGDG